LLEFRKRLLEKLNAILCDEEIKWRQMSIEKDLLKGDRNTKYFMLKSSARKRRNKKKLD
jgi:hypothetical protein